VNDYGLGHYECMSPGKHCESLVGTIASHGGGSLLFLPTSEKDGGSRIAKVGRRDNDAMQLCSKHVRQKMDGYCDRKALRRKDTPFERRDPQ